STTHISTRNSADHGAGRARLCDSSDCHVAKWNWRTTVDDGIMGNSGWNHRRALAEDRYSCWGDGEFVRTVQCVVDELLSPSAGDGERWTPASHLCPRISAHGRSLGCNHQLRDSL